MLQRVKHYNIIEELGKGGMGVVYKAEDTRLKRTVALKVLSPHLADDPDTKKRFLREAQLAASLQHQNICTIHEIGETTDNQLYISMDYYEGESLQKLISGDLLSLDTLLKHATQITEGISAAHGKGIVHRDIKPGNIIFTKTDNVKILDFGLAKQSGRYDSSQTGKALGTISYLSPEQALGKNVDHLSDIWSLGVVLYEMATGILPFSHEYEAAVIYSILDKSPLPPTELRDDLPDEMDEIVYKCLRKTKEERYQSAGDVLKELTSLKEKLHNSSGKRTVKPPSRKRLSERRLVTIISSEITSYKDLFKGMEEEQSNVLMNRCFEIFESTSRKYGGTFTWKGQGGFRIIFGLPKSLEKAPLLAVRTCIELQTKIKELKLSLRSGIHSGMVIYNPVRINEREEIAISGFTIDFANRLMEISSKEQILVGPMIYRNTNKLFDYLALNPITSEVSQETVHVHQLLSRKESVSPEATDIRGMIHSKMVGREEELDILQYHLLKLIHGEGSIINIVGEAGLGKSRLLAELMKKEEIKRVKVLEGRALSTGQNLSFHPLMDILRDLAGIKETDVEDSVLNKLQSTVQKLCPDSADEVFPFVATLMGLNLSGRPAELINQVEGDGLEKLILKNLRTLLSGAAKKNPLLFIVEDLHWADQSSVGMLKSLYRLAEAHSILFINVLRPDYPETEEHIRTAIKDRYEKIRTEIILKSLNESQSELLIQELLNTKILPAKISAQINKRGEGNPFFLEEVIHSMIDEKLILFEDGKARISTRIESVVIPHTIHEVLMVRIDKLDEDTRLLVKLASVIGRQFFYSLIVEVAGSELDVNQKLEYLEKNQLIRKRRRMEEDEYLFRHALIHQAVYNTIPSAQQKDMHLKVAMSIEKVFKPRLSDFYGILAYHYSCAEELDRAESYLIQAGEKALKSSASSEALHYFKGVLDIYLDKYGNKANQNKVATLHKYIGIAYFNMGHLIESADYLEKVLSFHGMKIPKNPLVLIFRMIKGLFIFLFRLRFTASMGRRTPGKLEVEINELITKKCSALVITDTKRFMINMLLYVPWLTSYHFKNPDSLVMAGGIFSMGGISLTLADRAVDVYMAKSDQDDLKSKITSNFGRITTRVLAGWWDDSPLDEDMVDKGLLIGESYNLFNYVGFKAHELLELGNRQAEKILDKLLEMSEMYENDFGRLAYYTHSSLYLLKYREFNNALARAEEGIEFVRKNLGNKPGLLMIYSMKVRSQIMLGNFGGAEETLLLANEFASQDRQAPYFLSFYLTARLLFYTHRYEQLMQGGDKNQLSVLRKNSLKTAKKAKKVSDKAAYERVETYRLTGLIHWLTGKQGKALKWWGRAMNEAENLGAKLELALTLEEVARRLSGPSSKHSDIRGESIGALNQRATILFKEMEIKTS